MWPGQVTFVEMGAARVTGLDFEAGHQAAPRRSEGARKGRNDVGGTSWDPRRGRPRPAGRRPRCPQGR